MPEDATEFCQDVELEAKVSFLSQTKAYTEVPHVVQTKETHMSWVFLTNDHAYKLKKPVRRSFLDFSTLEARRRNCEAEVRLNRRLAPDVYIGTVALKVDPKGQLHLEGPGRTVDWLVKTRRLTPETTLEHAILTEVVQESDVRRLAVCLAAFYKDAVPVDTDPATYRRTFEDNVRANHQELARPAFGLPRDLVDELAAGQLGFIAKRGDLLEERVRLERIVEGHGDLRPEHIHLGDQPVVIDCLEFNRDFRTLDPVDELAYLAMECDRLNARFIDGWLFETYENEVGVGAPRVLIDFYKCFRAYLRAKISIWHLDDHGVQKRSKWTARTDQYLRLACDYSRRLT